MAADSLVRDWLVDCKALSPSEEHSFACTLAESGELVQSIFSILDDRNKHAECLDPICSQLFSFSRSREVQLRRFALQYLPALIAVYLCSLAQGDKKGVKCVEVLLLGIYNLEVVDTAGHGHACSFRLPCVMQPSIYHAPMSLASASLTETALSRLDKGDSSIIAIGPFSQMEAVNAHNRMMLVTVLMNLYNRNISYMSKPSLLALCKICSRLCRQGFCKPGTSHRTSYCMDSHVGSQFSRSPCRVPLAPSFVLEILHGIYYSMYNGFVAVGLQALDDAHARASHDMMAEVVLVTNAIRNAVHASPAGQPGDGPMGISISVSPTTSMTTFSKSIITNASFRTKKLPDDIPIQTFKEGDGSTAAASSDLQKSLATISEEADDSEKSQSVAKDKAKDKEKTMAPLKGMITKIGEKTKFVSSKKSLTNDEQQQQQQQQSISQQQQQVQAVNKSNMGSASSLASIGAGGRLSSGSADSRKKDGESTAATTKGSHKDVESSGAKVQNGDSVVASKDHFARTEVVLVKNQPRTRILMDTIEMKALDGGGGGVGGTGGVTASSDHAGSLSSSHSSLEDDEDDGVEEDGDDDDDDDDKGDRTKEDTTNKSDEVPMSRSEFHTLV